MILEKDSTFLEKYRVLYVDDTCPFYEIAIVEYIPLNRYEVLYLFSKDISSKNELCEILKNDFKRFAYVTSDNLPEFIHYGEYENQPFFTRKYVQGKSAAELYGSPENFSLDAFLLFLAEIISYLIYFSNNSICWERISLNDIKIDNNNKIFFVHFNFPRFLINYKDKLNDEQKLWIEKTSGLFIKHDEKDTLRLIYSLGELLYEMIIRKGLTNALNNYHRNIDERAKLKKKKRDVLPPLRLNPNLSENIETIILRAVHPRAAGGYKNLNALLEDVLKVIGGQEVTVFNYAESSQDTEQSSGRFDLENPFQVSISALVDKPSKDKVKFVKEKTQINYVKFIKIFAVIIFVAIIAFAAISYIPTLTHKNNIPTAIASTSKTFAETGNEIILDGSKSSDPDNDQLDFFWSIDEPKDAQVIFSKNRTHDAVITKVIFLTNGNYKISLKVFDGKQFSEPFFLNIKVR